MKAKKFFIIFLSVIVGAIGIIAAANYRLDYYGIFHPEQEVFTTGINDRFVKMRYLLLNDNFKKYDSYLWGSSRVMKMDTKVTGERTYNFGEPAGMFQDYLIQLNLLLKHGAQINTIYLGIDEFTYLRDYSRIKTNAFGYLYQEDLPKDMEAFSYYLFRPSIISHALREKEGEAGITLLHTTGTRFVPEYVEANIEKNPDEYVHLKKFSEPITIDEDDENYQYNLNTLKDIIDTCKKHQISLRIFFNPIEDKRYLANNIMWINRFKKDLAHLTPFWDFSGINYVTANNYFWYDRMHPRAFICDKILDTVSGQNQMTWVPDFGVYVTEENVDELCEKAVRDREAYDPNHEQWVPGAEERAVMTKRVNYPW